MPEDWLDDLWPDPWCPNRHGGHHSRCDGSYRWCECACGLPPVTDVRVLHLPEQTPEEAGMTDVNTELDEPEHAPGEDDIDAEETHRDDGETLEDRVVVDVQDDEADK